MAQSTVPIREAAIQRLMGNSAVPGQVRTPRHTPSNARAQVRLGGVPRGMVAPKVPQLERGRV